MKCEQFLRCRVQADQPEFQTRPKYVYVQYCFNFISTGTRDLEQGLLYHFVAFKSSLVSIPGTHSRSSIIIIYTAVI